MNPDILNSKFLNTMQLYANTPDAEENAEWTPVVRGRKPLTSAQHKLRKSRRQQQRQSRKRS